MAITVIGEDEAKQKKTACGHCAAILMYTIADTREDTPDGETLTIDAEENLDIVVLHQLLPEDHPIVEWRDITAAPQPVEVAVVQPFNYPAVCEAVEGALRTYRMRNYMDGDNQGSLLVDHFSLRRGDIGPGITEVELLADHITDELEAQAPPAKAAELSDARIMQLWPDINLPSVSDIIKFARDIEAELSIAGGGE